jgi:hypothetical protein
MYTHKNIYDIDPTGTMLQRGERRTEQIARFLARGFVPYQAYRRASEGLPDYIFYDLVGTRFPLRGMYAEAARIRANLAGRAPIDPKRSANFQKILMAIREAKDGNPKMAAELNRGNKLGEGEKKMLRAGLAKPAPVFALYGFRKPSEAYAVWKMANDEERKIILKDSSCRKLLQKRLSEPDFKEKYQEDYRVLNEYMHQPGVSR